MIRKISLGILAILFFALTFYVLIVLPKHKKGDVSLAYDQNIFSTLHYEVPGEKIGEYESFATEQEFLAYLEEMPQGGYIGTVPEVMMEARANVVVDDVMIAGDTVEARDFSQTNVQVQGIDEPDMVKTDGTHIFVNREQSFAVEPVRILAEDGVVENYGMYQQQAEVAVVRAYPPADLAKITEIDVDGDLLLYENIVIVLGDAAVRAFDISTAEAPQEVWSMAINENNRVSAARLIENDLYIINETVINSETPCPIRPLYASKDVTIPCHSIYHPVEPSYIDMTYTVFKVDVRDGDIQDQTSFVGSSQQSAVYMSHDALYVSHQHQLREVEMMFEFLLEKRELLPKTVVEKIRKLDDYHISDTSKMNELMLILDEYEQSLEKDERLRIQNEMENAARTYMERRKRDVEQTGIAKIDLDAMKITQTGYVPGRLLNQFSLDEYEGFLRVATTVGGTWNRLGAQQQSVNDVYVLNDTMSIVGAVENMGEDERIYAVRFLGDKGYIVTFKQIDPFIVLDLKDPHNPQKKGELKIPGFSSYLHPLLPDRILGIGKEDNRVKLSLFDVSDEDNPQEISKYILDEYWSEIAQTHHAFMLDERHNLFFIPGSRGGYVFTYSDTGIALTHAIEEPQVKRALYIGEYLYVVTQEKIVVLNIQDWERVQEISFVQEEE